MFGAVLIFERASNPGGLLFWGGLDASSQYRTEPKSQKIACPRVVCHIFFCELQIGKTEQELCEVPLALLIHVNSSTSACCLKWLLSEVGQVHVRKVQVQILVLA